MKRIALLAAMIVSLPAVGEAGYMTTILADNPVGYWRLNDVAGATSAVNLGTGGAALNGVYTPGVKVDGTGLPSGVSPGALFNNPGGGTMDGNHVVGAGIASAFSGSWTIEGWFVRNSATPAGAIFSDNGTLGDHSGPVLTFGDPVGGTDMNTLYLMNSSRSWANPVALSLGAGSIGKAVYAALSYDATTQSASLYAHVDGSDWVSNKDQTVVWAADLLANDAFTIGQHAPFAYGDGGYPFDGTIGDVAVYNRALSESDVLAHFNASVPEPNAILLLLTSAFSLLAYAWRRRK